jgi:type I restriction enzyme S subunit
MSHYKPYPAYKDSGVEWIGKVPEGWRIVPLKALAQIVNGATPESGNPEYWDGDIAWFTPADLDNENVSELIEPRRRITAEGLASCAARLTPAGSVILSTRAPVGSVGVTLIPSATNQGCRTLVTNPRILPKLLAEMLVAARSELSLRSNGTTFQELSTDSLASLRIHLAPLEEQTAIVSFLDRETARIDALIAKKTEFIELLAKKRQALITHAVTKGLNPKAKMKDSGVEWIGDVPDHWLVAQLGKIAIARCDGPFGSGLKSEHYQPDGVRVIRLQNIGWASFKDGNEAFISHEHWRDVLGCGHEVLPDDVLIGGLGDDRNPLGRACVAPANLGPAMVKADCYRFRLNKNRAVPEFIALALSATARSECGYLATGATRDRLNLGLASARVVPIPPRNEQVDIVASLNRDTARIDLLASKTQHSIDLLKKRRSALITAAVTGQIDLREST